MSTNQDSIDNGGESKVSTGKSTNSMSDFFSFVGDFQSVIALMAKMAIAAPLLDFIFKVGPPWPSRSATAFFVVVLQILILIYAFEFWRHRSTAIKKVRVSLKYFVFLTPLALIGYVVVFSIWIGQLAPDDASSRFVSGFNYTESAEILRTMDEIPLSDRKLMEQLHKVDEVWTAGSLTVTRLVVLLSWISLWTSISIVIASFAAIQWKRQRK